MSGYGLCVRSIQYSRTANLRAAATLATAFGFWCVVATLPEPQPAAPSPAEEPPSSEVARTPPSAKESQSSGVGRAPAPATQPPPAPNMPSASLPSATEQRELQKAARAIPRALRGDWRDVKTLFEFAGIYPAKNNPSATDP